MAEALILDSEAFNAIANWSERGVLANRARAILAFALERRARVRVPAPVLAEVCRGPKFDAAINHALKARGIVVDRPHREHCSERGRDPGTSKAGVDACGRCFRRGDRGGVLIGRYRHRRLV